MLKALTTIALVLIMSTDTLIIPVHVQNENGGTKHVLVKNELGNGVVLYLHCRSKDDDLGLHVLQNGNYQEWSFRDNVIDTTLFWCSLKWNNQQHSFEIYSTINDGRRCASQCLRRIRPDGAYFFFEFEDYWVKEYAW
ncbi:S-protein homolog 3-like [Abrus precatorius]|uniref:S-protein homolog n=1 Tax=Abrus precatorius TaxID=3816 RepID=A0A8B8KH50_ABRPR|nr:S-protein homolog 3-like [Abrus precatorius]